MIYLGGKQGIKLHRGSRTKGRSKNTSLLIMGCPALRIWEYSRSTKGGGHCIHDPLQYDTDQKEDTRGSVLWKMGQAVYQGQGQKDISGCQS